MHLLRHRLRAVAAALCVAACAVTTTAAAADAAPAVPPPTLEGYAANAWGTTVTVDGVYTSGRTAPIGLGCTTSIGLSKENVLAAAQVPGLFSTAAIRNTATTVAAPGGGVAVTARSEIAGVSLLNGVVSVSSLVGQSTTTQRSNGDVSVTDAGTTLGRVTVLGIPIVDLRVNLRIGLPGIGYLVLDEQTRNGRGGLEVNLVHLHVDATNTDVIIGHANTNFGPDYGPLRGVAYAASADVANVVRIGKIAYQALGCTGTNGQIRTNTVSTVTLPGFGAAGVATSSVTGVVNFARDTASGRTQEVLAGLSLGGLVSASLITADVQADRANNRTVLTDRSSFANLTVLGRTYSANVPANTTVALAPGVTLYLHRVIGGGNRIEVRMIEIVVGPGTNSLGLPPLLDLQIGVAAVRAGEFDS